MDLINSIMIIAFVFMMIINLELWFYCIDLFVVCVLMFVVWVITLSWN